MTLPLHWMALDPVRRVGHLTATEYTEIPSGELRQAADRTPVETDHGTAHVYQDRSLTRADIDAVRAYLRSP